MSSVAAFRLLLVTFLVLYIVAMSLSGIAPDSPAEVLGYQQWRQQQPAEGSALWGVSILLGHLLDVIGLVLLFLRRKLGVYFLIAGFIACLGPLSGLPHLQDAPSALAMSFVNIAWGAILALSFAGPKDIFVGKAA
ncbi:MAG TPA: hypothetical protein VGE22_17955 [Solimonas sp.]